MVDVGESAPPNAPSGGTIGSSTVIKSTSSHSMRSKRSACTIHSRSRSTDDDITDNLTMEDAENVESSDPETATEVEISEKTLKFKISTEGTLASSTGGRKSYPGSRKGSREKSSLDYHNHDLAKAVRDHECERRRSRGENLGSDLSSPVSARSVEGTRIVEEEKEDTVFLDVKIEGKTPEGNGNVVVVEARSQPRNNVRKTSSVIENDPENRSNRRDAHSSQESIGLRCCCDDKTGPNNHKSIFSRLRNLTDRLSISFESKESPTPKPKHTKMLSKSNSVSSSSATSSRHHNSMFICKRCNLTKDSTKIATVVELSSVDKRAMTLPKVRKSTDCKNKSWRTVFAKEKRSSTSLEALPAASSGGSYSKHRRNLSNPEGKSQSMKEMKTRQRLDIEFQEITVRPKKQQQQPEIIVNPDDSVCDIEEDLGKVEIRRSSASMEDISKMAKQAEAVILGALDPKKAEERPHTGSLDSMLCKEVCKSRKKHPAIFSSPATTKKSSPGLFSRFKSGMSIDSTRSNSNSDSLHDHGSQSGWISSLTASFRPKRHPNETPLSPHPPRSPSREEIK